MLRTRILKGWKLWASIGLFACAFFFTAFSLEKISSNPGSRWDISWAAVVWLAAGATLVASLWSFLGSRH
jgi:hypothetical protein